MSADTGAIIGPVLAGLLIDHGSYPLAFGTTGLITLLAVIPWLRARETHDVRHPAPEPWTAGRADGVAADSHSADAGRAGTGRADAGRADVGTVTEGSRDA